MVSGINFIVNYRDLNCLGIWVLLYVMDMYYKNELYVFFGLLCIFVIFVVVCYFLYWGIFVIIFGVWVENFKDKEEFWLLICMMGLYFNIVDVVYIILKYFFWKLVGIILYNNLVVFELGDVDSYFLCKLVFIVLKRMGFWVWYS